MLPRKRRGGSGGRTGRREGRRSQRGGRDHGGRADREDSAATATQAPDASAVESDDVERLCSEDSHAAQSGWKLDLLFRHRVHIGCRGSLLKRSGQSVQGRLHTSSQYERFISWVTIVTGCAFSKAER